MFLFFAIHVPWQSGIDSYFSAKLVEYFLSYSYLLMM
jgi:hypothetical protein